MFFASRKHLFVLSALRQVVFYLVAQNSKAIAELIHPTTVPQIRCHYLLCSLLTAASVTKAFASKF